MGVHEVTCRPRLSVVLWALLLGSLGCASDPLDSEERQTRPVLVLGIDGATWDIIDPMVESGELPNLARLVDTGFRSDLISLPPLSSPVVWTTLATGRFPRDHNILHHTYPYRPGPKRKIQSTLRKVPALWNLAGHYGRTVNVVGYFATHPPDEVNGVMISDRAAEGVEGAVYPSSLGPMVQWEHEQVMLPERIREIRRQYLPWDYQASVLERPEDPLFGVSKVAKGRLTTRPLFETVNQELALKMVPREDDLQMIYVRMTDHASHSTWAYFDDSEFDTPVDPREQELLGGVIPASYRQVDGFLGRLLSAVERPTNVIIVSDHGFGPATVGWRASETPVKALSGDHRPNGIFLAAGPDVESGRIDQISILDVAPTLLALLDIPLSDELPGRVVEELFDPRRFESLNLDRVPQYRVRWEQGGPSEVPLTAEEESLESLSALGYIEAGTRVRSERDGEDLPFWEIDSGVRHPVVLGELMYHYLNEDLESLGGLLQLVAEKDPFLVIHLPRLVKKHAALWQSAVDYPLVSSGTISAFNTTYPDEFYRPSPGFSAPKRVDE